jgi:NADH-quinone oxidoreductase subunit C
MNFQEIFSRHELNVIKNKDALGNNILSINKDDLLKICELLKNDRLFNYEMLLAVIGIDCSEHFEVLYSFYSLKNNKKLFLKIILPKENPCIESLCGLYSSADWHERECFDLLGIEFLNHPKLERILLPKDWIGHPLRKDYKEEDERLSWNRR